LQYRRAEQDQWYQDIAQSRQEANLRSFDFSTDMLATGLDIASRNFVIRNPYAVDEDLLRCAAEGGSQFSTAVLGAGLLYSEAGIESSARYENRDAALNMLIAAAGQRLELVIYDRQCSYWNGMEAFDCPAGSPLALEILASIPKSCVLVWGDADLARRLDRWRATEMPEMQLASDVGLCQPQVIDWPIVILR